MQTRSGRIKGQTNTKMTAPTPTLSAANFLMSPFDGDINPSTTEGMRLFVKATSHLPSGEVRQDVCQKNANAFINQIRSDSANFGWGTLINQIEIDDNGTNVMKSILTDSRKLSMQQVQLQAYKTFGKHDATTTSLLPTSFVVQDISFWTHTHLIPIYYRRVRSKMIALRLQNIITKASWASLLAAQNDFTWTNSTGQVEWDGPTMLFILMKKVRPTTMVDIVTHKQKIKSIVSGNFEDNVQKMLDYMKSNYDAIQELGGSHDDYLLDIFQALSTVKNRAFSDFVSRERTEWFRDKTITPDTLITDALAQYNNLVATNEWSKKDPLETKFVSMMAQLQKTYKPSNPHQNKTTLSTITQKQPYRKPKFDLPSWRKKKTKDSVKIDGKTYHWCPKHKYEGDHDGLYVLHKPEDHDETMEKQRERRSAWKNKFPSNKSATSFSSSGNNSTLLTDSSNTLSQATSVIDELASMYSSN
jgi:hypothetical protein